MKLIQRTKTTNICEPHSVVPCVVWTHNICSKNRFGDRASHYAVQSKSYLSILFWMVKYFGTVACNMCILAKEQTDEMSYLHIVVSSNRFVCPTFLGAIAWCDLEARGRTESQRFARSAQRIAVVRFELQFLWKAKLNPCYNKRKVTFYILITFIK